MFTYDFGIAALLGGIFSAISTSMLGNIVVLRKMAFLGSGIAHLTFVGIGLALITGMNPLMTSLIVGVSSAVLLGYLSRKGVHEDIGIGVLFSTSMALGIVLISLSKTDTSRVMAYLFGDILALSWTDVTLSLLMAIAVVVFCLFFRDHLVYLTFDEDFSKILGIRSGVVYYTFLILLAISIVLSINLLGIVLVSAMVVIPAASSMLFARTYQGMFRLSPVLSTLSVFVGLLISWNYDIAAGAAIVIVQGTVFFVAFLVKVLS